jgi:hypothetical protein
MAEQKDPSAAILTSGGIIAGAIALSRQKVASGGNTVSLDAATTALLEAIATGQSAILDAITNLNLSGLVVSNVPNADDITCGRAQVAALNAAVALPDVVIPDDMEIQLKGWPTNGGLIYVARSAPQAINVMSVWPLLPNETIGYRIKNLNLLYFSGTQVGDWVTWTVEHRK